MPHQPNKPPQYMPNKNIINRQMECYTDIVDDRSPLQTPLQINPTTNPSEAKQVLDGMMQDQPMRWRDINNQDFL
jgi:hypothetical protein